MHPRLIESVLRKFIALIVVKSLCSFASFTNGMAGAKRVCVAGESMATGNGLRCRLSAMLDATIFEGLNDYGESLNVQTNKKPSGGGGE
jgi:hypothetical protein